MIKGSNFFTAGNKELYHWTVPESSGPGVSDPNCITFAYYSTVDFVKVSSY